MDITTGKARETKTGIEGALDVAFALDGHEGEVTLAWDEGNGRWGSWGDPDNWLDGRTLARIRELDHDDYRAMLHAIEEATRPVAKAFAAKRAEVTIDTAKVQNFAELAVAGMSDVQNVEADEDVETAASEIVAHWEGETGLLEGSALKRWQALSPTSGDEDELRGRCISLVEAAIRRQRAA